MTPLADGSGGRILIDPEDLRQVATKMRGAAVVLSTTGRQVGARSMPAMPAAVAAAVTDVACHVNAELQELAVELIQDAGTLFARATWAELGGGDEVAWLIPGLLYSPAAPPEGDPATPTSALPRGTDEEILTSEQWAIALLDGMHDSMDLLNEEADRLRSKADDPFGSRFISFPDEYADEIPVETLGKFTLLAGMALDPYQHRDQGMGARAGMSAGGGAAGGALGVLACEAVFGTTAVGLVGCLAVGGVAGDQLGDAVFDG